VRARQAEVARSRAAYFAQGGGIGRGVVGEEEEEEEGGGEGAAAPPSGSGWHGPMSVGMELLRGRGRAAAKREEGKDVPAEEGELSELERQYVPSWKPSAKVAPDAGAARDSLSTLVGAGEEATGGRRALAIAGPSGVRLAVPRLGYWALSALVPVLPSISDLSPLPSQLRRGFADAVCRARGLDGHAFQLFASAAAGRGLASDEDGSEAAEATSSGGRVRTAHETLDIPDCAGVDEAACIAGLSASAGHLVGLHLGHCGRAISDRSLRSLLSPSLTTSVFGSLQSLHLGGPYAMSEAALASVLSATPSLTSLALSSAVLLDGAFILILPKCCPALAHLDIASCPAIGDSALLGTSQSGLPRGAKRPRVEEAGAGAGAGAGDALRAGILALPRLTSISLAYAPAVTDASIVAWLAAHTVPGGGSAPARVTALKLNRCGGVTNATCIALAEHITGSQGLGGCALTSLTLEHQPKVTDYGLLALARALTPSGAVRELSLHGCASLSSAALLQFIVAAGARSESFRSVNLCGLSHLTDVSLVAISRHAPALTDLDVSFCRRVTDAGLGQMADACIRLSRLVLWGCTQLTGTFFNGHARAEGKGLDPWEGEGAGGAVPLRIYGRPGDVLAAPAFD